MATEWWFTLLIVVTALERLYELVVSRRNAAWSFSQGGKEVGQEHFPFMVLLHSGFLVACLVEVWWLRPAFEPLFGWSMLLLAIAAQGLRWWCITTLGPRWNTRVIFVPGLPRVDGGPYRWFSHPNYVAVVVEGLVLPLVHGAWYTAIAFTLLNAWLLKVRIGVENRALQTMESSAAAGEA